jgi:hypothetical protein
MVGWVWDEFGRNPPKGNVKRDASAEEFVASA